MESAVEEPNRTGMEYNPSCLSKSVSWQAYKISKPAIYVINAKERNRISPEKVFATATHAPIGANDITNPRYKWESQVNRLVQEYRNSRNRTGIEKIRQMVSSMADANINKQEKKQINRIAEYFEIFPDGISLVAVLGFFLSNCSSATRFTPIAADRAPTMAIIIQHTSENEIG